MSWIEQKRTRLRRRLNVKS